MKFHFKTRGIQTDYSAWQLPSTEVEQAFSYLEDRTASVLLYRTDASKDIIVSSFIQDSGKKDYQKTPIRLLFSISDLNSKDSKKIIFQFLQDPDFLKDEILSCITWKDQEEGYADDPGWIVHDSSSLESSLLQSLEKIDISEVEEILTTNNRYLFPLDEMEDGIDLLKKYNFSDKEGIKFVYSSKMLHPNKAEEIKSNADLIIANYKSKQILPSKKSQSQSSRNTTLSSETCQKNYLQHLIGSKKNIAIASIILIVTTATIATIVWNKKKDESPFHFITNPEQKNPEQKNPEQKSPEQKSPELVKI